MIQWLQNYSGTELIVVFFAYIIAVMFAIMSHEIAHGYIALKNGDDTARLAGRLSFNPVKHFDLWGAICFAFIGFGWAKPVPINPNRFRNHKKGVITTSIAGVVTNFILGFFSVGLLVLTNKFFFSTNNIASSFLTVLFSVSAYVNFALAIFNLLPIYPLDGFNLIAEFLPYNNKFISFMRRYGNIFLILIIVTPVFSTIYSFFVDGIFNGLLSFWSMIFGV